MVRICKFFHEIAKDKDRCREGHMLCTTLECQVRDCKYSTGPFSTCDIRPVIDIMQMHMKGANPELKNNENSDD